MWLKVGSLVAILVLAWAPAGFARCRGTIINPINDVCWECMFPARVGVVSYGRSGDVAPGGNIGSPACACINSSGATLGIKVSFWEHAYLVETVKDPWCMVALGTGMGTNMNKLQGGINASQSASGGDSQLSFQQVHWYKFPVWSMLNLFVDFPCNEQSVFDLAYPSEVDPTWNDDMLSFILNPEALLFGNPITQLSCMADSAMTSMGQPLDPLFWCMGSWGGAYPLNGSSNTSNPNHLNGQMVGRMTYKLSREGLLRDTAVDESGCSPMGKLAPIWNKGNWRIQVARPRKKKCMSSFWEIGIFVGIRSKSAAWHWFARA